MPLQGRRIIDEIGNTPLVEIKRIAAEVAPVRIFAKAEWFNPGGSVKDRAALNMIRDGEKQGRLTPEKVLLDATSGNTGIAYAMIGAALGYRVRLAVPANVGPLHRRILACYGAELVFTSAQEGSDGAIREAMRLFHEEPEQYFYPDQYNNPANWQAHYNGTAPEILEQTAGEVTHFIAGLGTSGTFVGTARRLREFRSDIRLISFQPESPLHGLEGLKHMATSIVPGIYDSALADEDLAISSEEAQEMAQRLGREEGLLVGLSSGAAMVAALQVARRLSAGRIVTVFPDSAHKYLEHRFWTGE